MDTTTTATATMTWAERDLLKRAEETLHARTEECRHLWRRALGPEPTREDIDEAIDCALSWGFTMDEGIVAHEAR